MTHLRCRIVADTRHPLFTRSTTPTCPACEFSLVALAPRGTCPECGADYDPSNTYAIVPPPRAIAIRHALTPLRVAVVAAVPVFVLEVIYRDVGFHALIPLREWCLAQSVVGLGLVVSAMQTVLYFGALVAEEPGRKPLPPGSLAAALLAIMVLANVVGIGAVAVLMPVLGWLWTSFFRWL